MIDIDFSIDPVVIFSREEIVTDNRTSEPEICENPDCRHRFTVVCTKEQLGKENSKFGITHIFMACPNPDCHNYKTGFNEKSPGRI